MKQEYLSLGVEYLGFLNAQLRDLRGYTSLANELIQNADDAPGATEIVFNVCDDTLIVENNGIFSDCGQMQERDCPWLKDPQKKHRCDFHRFRLTASGDKRRQEDTIGAFGVGFIAVYQITDRPELLSQGRHWIIRPEHPTERRIQVLQPMEGFVGTRFRLPWATDSDTGLRNELGVEPITPAHIQELLDELERVLPSSLLFLRKLTRIVLQHNGRLIKEIEIIHKDQDQISIEERTPNDVKTNLWHLFPGDFEAQAREIRARIGSQIEGNRSSNVVVAIPQADDEGASIQGLFHAYLPTQHQTGLPLHINADFFPSSDRKRILLGKDYQGAWNAAAIRTAAHALSQALPQLQAILEHTGLWHLLNQIRELARDVVDDPRRSVLGSFWQEIRNSINDLALVYTSRHGWRRPAQVRLLRNKDKEEPCLPILEELDLDIVHPDLNPYSNLLREVDVAFLDASDLAAALKRAGLDDPMPIENAPRWIQPPEARETLSDEIAILLSRTSGPHRLDECAIACSTDGWLCPPIWLRRAGPDILTTFNPLNPRAAFAADDNPAPILALVPLFAVADALKVLEGSYPKTLQALWNDSPEQYLDLLNWFAERPAKVRSNPDYPQRLQRLCIWPSGKQLYPLGELVVPGGFKDPLQLTNLVDPQVVERCGEFLIRELEAQVLTISTYMADHVPQAFRSDEGVSVQACRKLIVILAKNLGQVRGNPRVLGTLRTCPLVECTDDNFRKPEDVYFDSELVSSILGDSVPVARIPSRRQAAVGDLLDWLGVTDVPRPAQIIRRIARIVAQPPDEPRRKAIQQIFAQLGAEWNQAFADQHAQFDKLTQLTWLPARQDNEKWYAPSGVYAAFQEYLFASQATFLDIPFPQQTNTRRFMEFLGIPATPTTLQVVRHLLQAAKNEDFELNREVYRFLNDHADDPKILRLKDKRCLLLEGDQFVHPNKVFWGEHLFGKYRFRLSDQFRAYGQLLDRLDVKVSPTPMDAIQVLKEISDEYEEMAKVPLDDERYSVVMQCWKMLGDSLEAGEITDGQLWVLRDARVIPEDRRMLYPPKWVYFEDRPGLREKFGSFLDHNVIPRPQGAWQAMQAAGVRPLSQAVTTRLVECTNPVLSNDVQNLLKQRRHLIARVLAAQKDGDWRRDLLPRLEIQCAEQLMLTHTVQAFNRTVPTPAEQVLAYFDPDTDPEIIYFVNGDNTPWSAIARELAYALNPLGEAGQLAPGLKEVLRGDSVQSADQELSELGFAPLQTLDGLRIPESAPIAPGGAEAYDPSDTEWTDKDIEYDPDILARLATSSKKKKDIAKPPVSSTDTPDTSKEVYDTPPDDDSERPTKSPPKDKDKTKDDKKPKKKKKKQGRFSTYVYYKDPDEDDDETESEIEKIRSIDRAGIELVLDFEREAGRTAKEMPHKHPGYDIESSDEHGVVARYIEVKSTADDWDDRGVGLTHTQFEKAQELGNRYWLYVVERAESDQAQVYPIQDPANKVNRFFYDDGWRALAWSEGELDVSVPKRRSILDLKE